MPKRSERIEAVLRAGGHDEPAKAMNVHDLADAIGATTDDVLKAVRQSRRLRIWQEVWLDDTET